MLFSVFFSLPGSWLVALGWALLVKSERSVSSHDLPSLAPC